MFSPSDSFVHASVFVLIVSHCSLLRISFAASTPTVTMTTRKSSRVPKDTAGSGTVSVSDETFANAFAGIKDTSAPEKASTGISTEIPPKAASEDAAVFAVHFKARGTIVSTGSLDEANTLLGQLPESVIVDCGIAIKQFGTSVDLDRFRASLKADNEAYAASKTSVPLTMVPHASAQAKYDVKRANLKRSENPIALGLDEIPQVNEATANKVVMEPSSSTDNQSAEGVLASQSPAAKRMRSVIRTKGMKLIIHYWPGVPDSAIAQIVFIDIIDTRQDFTHWLQRPEKWVDVFGNIEQSVKILRIPW